MIQVLKSKKDAKIQRFRTRFEYIFMNLVAIYEKIQLENKK